MNYHGKWIMGFAGHGLDALILNIIYGLVGIAIAFLLVKMSQAQNKWYHLNYIFFVLWPIGCAYSAYLGSEIKHIFFGTYCQHHFLWWEIAAFAYLALLGIASTSFQIIYVIENIPIRNRQLIAYSSIIFLTFFGVYLGLKDINLDTLIGII